MFFQRYPLCAQRPNISHYALNLDRPLPPHIGIRSFRFLPHLSGGAFKSSDVEARKASTAAAEAAGKPGSEDQSKKSKGKRSKKGNTGFLAMEPGFTLNGLDRSDELLFGAGRSCAEAEIKFQQDAPFKLYRVGGRRLQQAATVARLNDSGITSGALELVDSECSSDEDDSLEEPPKAIASDAGNPKSRSASAARRSKSPTPSSLPSSSLASAEASFQLKGSSPVAREGTTGFRFLNPTRSNVKTQERRSRRFQRLKSSHDFNAKLQGLFRAKASEADLEIKQMFGDRPHDALNSDVLEGKITVAGDLQGSFERWGACQSWENPWWYSILPLTTENCFPGLPTTKVLSNPKKLALLLHRRLKFAQAAQNFPEEPSVAAISAGKGFYNIGSRGTAPPATVAYDGLWSTGGLGPLRDLGSRLKCMECGFELELVSDACWNPECSRSIITKIRSVLGDEDWDAMPGETEDDDTHEPLPVVNPPAATTPSSGGAAPSIDVTSSATAVLPSSTRAASPAKAAEASPVPSVAISEAMATSALASGNVTISTSAPEAVTASTISVSSSEAIAALASSSEAMTTSASSTEAVTTSASSAEAVTTSTTSSSEAMMSSTTSASPPPSVPSLTTSTSTEASSVSEGAQTLHSLSKNEATTNVGSPVAPSLLPGASADLSSSVTPAAAPTAPTALSAGTAAPGTTAATVDTPRDMPKSAEAAPKDAATVATQPLATASRASGSATAPNERKPPTQAEELAASLTLSEGLSGVTRADMAPSGLEGDASDSAPLEAAPRWKQVILDLIDQGAANPFLLLPPKEAEVMKEVVASITRRMAISRMDKDVSFGQTGTITRILFNLVFGKEARHAVSEHSVGLGPAGSASMLRNVWHEKQDNAIKASAKRARSPSPFPHKRQRVEPGVEPYPRSQRNEEDPWAKSGPSVARLKRNLLSVVAFPGSPAHARAPTAPVSDAAQQLLDFVNLASHEVVRPKSPPPHNAAVNSAAAAAPAASSAPSPGSTSRPDVLLESLKGKEQSVEALWGLREAKPNGSAPSEAGGAAAAGADLWLESHPPSLLAGKYHVPQVLLRREAQEVHRLLAQGNPQRTRTRKRPPAAPKPAAASAAKAKAPAAAPGPPKSAAKPKKQAKPRAAKPAKAPRPRGRARGRGRSAAVNNGFRSSVQGFESMSMPSSFPIHTPSAPASKGAAEDGRAAGGASKAQKSRSPAAPGSGNAKGTKRGSKAAATQAQRPTTSGGGSSRASKAPASTSGAGPRSASSNPPLSSLGPSSARSASLYAGVRSDSTPLGPSTREEALGQEGPLGDSREAEVKDATAKPPPGFLSMGPFGPGNLTPADLEKLPRALPPSPFFPTGLPSQSRPFDIRASDTHSYPGRDLPPFPSSASYSGPPSSFREPSPPRTRDIAGPGFGSRGGLHGEPGLTKEPAVSKAMLMAMAEHSAGLSRPDDLSRGSYPPLPSRHGDSFPPFQGPLPVLPFPRRSASDELPDFPEAPSYPPVSFPFSHPMSSSSNADTMPYGFPHSVAMPFSRAEASMSSSLSSPGAMPPRSMLPPPRPFGRTMGKPMMRHGSSSAYPPYPPYTPSMSYGSMSRSLGPMNTSMGPGSAAAPFPGHGPPGSGGVNSASSHWGRSREPSSGLYPPLPSDMMPGMLMRGSRGSEADRDM